MKPPRYFVTMLTEGTYHGIAGGQNFWPASEIAAAAPSMKGKPVYWNHDGPEVGRVVEAYTEGRALKGVIEIDDGQPMGNVARGYLDGALKLGAVPNGSVDGRFYPRLLNGQPAATGIQFTGYSLVPRGACSDTAGCGIMAALSEVSHMNEITTPTASTTASTAGPVEFTIVHKLAKAAAETTEMKPCECAKLAAAASEKERLEAQLAAVTKQRDDLMAEKERAPLVAELAAVAPGYKADGKTVAQLTEALEAAKLAAASTAQPARKSMLAAASDEQPKHSPEYGELQKIMGLAK